MQTSSEPNAEILENLNDTSISAAETQSGDEHEPDDNANNDAHVDAQPSNNNDVEIEPAVDLDNPQSRNQRYVSEILLLGSTVKKENHGFRNPYPFLLNHPSQRMMRILSALLK